MMGIPKGSLSYETFVELDDTSFLRRLEDLTLSTARNSLSSMARSAIDILLGGSEEYATHWLAIPSTRPPKVRERLPADVIADTFWDEERHRIYQPRSILIDRVTQRMSRLPSP